MMIGVITGHGIHVHCRLAKSSQDALSRRQKPKAARPKTTANRATLSNTKRPLSVAGTTDKIQNIQPSKRDAEDKPGLKNACLLALFLSQAMNMFILN